jgi:hypothetical protein
MAFATDRLNHQTRHVHLWLTQDEDTFMPVRSRVRLAQLAGDPDDTLYQVSDWLKSYVEGLAEMIFPGAIKGDTLLTDLVVSALSQVDWHQLAAFYMAPT